MRNDNLKSGATCSSSTLGMYKNIRCSSCSKQTILVGKTADCNLTFRILYSSHLYLAVESFHSYFQFFCFPFRVYCCCCLTLILQMTAHSWCIKMADAGKFVVLQWIEAFPAEAQYFLTNAMMVFQIEFISVNSSNPLLSHFAISWKSKNCSWSICFHAAIVRLASRYTILVWHRSTWSLESINRMDNKN